MTGKENVQQISLYYSVPHESTGKSEPLKMTSPLRHYKFSPRSVPFEGIGDVNGLGTYLEGVRALSGVLEETVERIEEKTRDFEEKLSLGSAVVEPVSGQVCGIRTHF
jgi:hypothetical protein